MIGFKKIATVSVDKEWYAEVDDFTSFEKQPQSLELEGKFLKQGPKSIVGAEYFKKVCSESGILFNYQLSINIITKKIY